MQLNAVPEPGQSGRNVGSQYRSNCSKSGTVARVASSKNSVSIKSVQGAVVKVKPRREPQRRSRVGSTRRFFNVLFKSEVNNANFHVTGDQHEVSGTGKEEALNTPGSGRRRVNTGGSV